MAIYCENCPAVFVFLDDAWTEDLIWDILTEHNAQCHKIPYAETKRGRTKYFKAGLA